MKKLAKILYILIVIIAAYMLIERPDILVAGAGRIDGQPYQGNSLGSPKHETQPCPYNRHLPADSGQCIQPIQPTPFMEGK